MGVARSNLENHARDKSVAILQCFSCNVEGMKLMIAKPRPEVKSVDAVVTCYAATLRTEIIAREVVQHSRMCTAMHELARTKLSGAMRGSANSCFLNTSNARTLKLVKTDLWLAFCAHQNS